MTPADLGRIAFVTRRYPELQGLRSVAFGAALVAFVFAFEFLPSPFDDPMIRVFLYGLMVSNASLRPLDHYYQRLFGMVAKRQGRWDLRTILTDRGVFPGLVASGLVLDMLILGFARVPAPSLGGVALIALSVWVLVRDWPHRFHYLIAVAAGAAACVIVAMAPPPTGADVVDPIVAGYHVVGAGMIGLALIATGLLDHRLLARAMWRPAEGAEVANRPPIYLSGLRIVLSISVLAVVLIYIAFAGWPVDSIAFTFTLNLAILPTVVWAGWDDMSWNFRAHAEFRRAREARLLARLNGASADEVEKRDVHAARIPKPDFWGHLALPLLLACGALIDIAFRAGSLPLLMPITLALLHGHIAVRDWAARKHYLFGAVAAAVMAVAPLFVAQMTALDWFAAFLLLFGTANLIEGLLDRRLEYGRREFVNGRHAHTV